MSPKGNKKAGNNPNGGPAKRQDKRNKNKDSGSDVSNSDNEQTNNKNNPSKRTRTLPDNPMEEDYVADSAADAGGSNTTPPQQNNADNFSSPPPKDTTAPSAPGSVASGTDASMHAPKDKETSPLDASPNKDIMDTNDTSPLPPDTPTISILRRDYQAAAAPNTSPEFVKKYPTNRAMIDAVNNLLLETYHSYTAVLQLRTDEDLRAIQVTDIPFFIKKDDITALFKKYGNIQSCRLHTRANAKVQQARIVYDDVSSIQHFMDKQWAIYCYSTCLRITPCSLTLDQKKSRREFVAVLSQLPPNTKDVHLAPLVRAVGAMAVNIPLSLNSYKPKRWAYITFKSQQMMDTAMEQSIALQGHRFQWELPENTNKLCHRCGKLGCAPTACPLNNSRCRSRTRNPVAHLKERFNIGKDRSVSFSTSQRNNIATPNSSAHKPPLVDPNCSQIQEILSVLKSLQEDMASVRARIHALELADQRMSRLECHIFGHLQDDVLPPDPNDSSHMIVDDHQRTPSYLTQSNPPPSTKRFSGPVLPPPMAPVPRSNISSSTIPETADEATINKERAEIYSFQRSLDNKFDHLSGSIERFISSISGGSSSDLVNKTSSN
ncbi:hypothetical protein RhiirA5_403424 [Rhizophagus irregularis]|uniref:RRM domain-containing protein n=1 Tax=Rhizophagus irregularis TaxID=588596 RepID=A0A2N0NZH0_9GLOM|nr:hypothetical protein RhiirA5_403424 [Rhizophagus irregularis]